MLSALPVAFYTLKWKGGEETEPDAEPQKPWVSSPLAGRDAPVPASGRSVASQWPCPSVLHCGRREPGGARQP